MNRFVPFLMVLACQGADVSLGEPDDGGRGTTGAAEATTSDDTASGTVAGPTASVSTVTSTTGAETSEGEASSLGATEGSSTTNEPPSGGTVLFVNFAGADLSLGEEDDARADTTNIEPLAVALQPFGGGDQPAEVLAAVAAHWAPFDVSVVSERPAAGDYTMVVVTPTNPFGSVLGVAPVDCGNSNRNNIAVVFIGARDGVESGFLAGTISRELGSTFGLEHVDAPGDLMHRPGPAGGATFTHACVPVAVSLACREQHLEHCEANMQNSAAELESLTQL